MRGGALFSSCGRYRHLLWRAWDETLPTMVWAMLNPSKAGWPGDDATIRRCTGYAKAWGYGGYDVVNLTDVVETDSKKMLRMSYAELSLGDSPAIKLRALGQTTVGLVVVAWGASVDGHGALEHRARDLLGTVTAAGHRSHCLGTTKAGHPLHPVRLPKGLVPRPFSY